MRSILPPHAAKRDPASAPKYGLVCRWWWLLVPGLVGMAVWLWLRTDSSVHATRAQSLLQQAEAALARGHLSAPDGSGARELYEAALAMDPDLPEARHGQVQVGLAALEHAEAALARGDIPAAQHGLVQARQLQVPRAEWEPLAAALHQQPHGQVSLEALLERAQAARAQGWLADVPAEFPGETAALPLYQQILAQQPGHTAALRGRGDALAELLDGARAALRTGDLDTAFAAIAATRTYDPGHPDLPDTLARLAEERTALQQRAAHALARGQEEAALRDWQWLLALDPNDPEARSGIERTAQSLAERAAMLGQSHQFDQAERTLARARELAPGIPALHAAEVRIARAREQQTTDGAAVSLQVAGDCFEANLAANNLGRARECLDAARAQGEAVDTLGARRRQLALRWVAIGEERLRSGDLPAATAALNAARELDPTTPGLQALAQRLETAER